MDTGIQILGKRPADAGRILTPDALAFLARLSRKFEPTRRALLARRAERQQRFDAGELPDFLPETETIRKGEWKVAATPPDLGKLGGEGSGHLKEASRSSTRWSRLRSSSNSSPCPLTRTWSRRAESP